jgi:glutamate racemase
VNALDLAPDVVVLGCTFFTLMSVTALLRQSAVQKLAEAR